jgi:hypothetical protein
MRVALLTTFAASRKDQLGSVMERIRQAFLDAGLGEPAIRFNFGDSVTPGFVSSVDRVLKRHPNLARFVTTAVPMPQIPGARRISNGPLSPAAGEAVPFATLQAIAAGVPRSFPFHSIVIHFHSPEFGDLGPTNPLTPDMLPGVLLSDSWWVSGRNRALSACSVVDGDPGSKKLPSPPAPVAAILAACGKIRKTVQAPLPGEIAGPTPAVRLPQGSLVPSADPKAALAVHQVVLKYRAGMKEVVERARMPHELPAPGPDAMRDAGMEVTSGPRKPALEQAFKPLGYSCKGGSGTFTLRRRTAANLTAELYMDVGTWGHSVLAMFRVLGLGFRATLSVPVSPTAIPAGQYPIGNAERWRKIVENLAALVAELDRSFVPEIEAAAGASPEWYRPES